MVNLWLIWHAQARVALFGNMCEPYHYVVDNEGISYEVTSVGPKRKMKLAELSMATLVKPTDNNDNDNDNDDNKDDAEIPKLEKDGD